MTSPKGLLPQWLPLLCLLVLCVFPPSSGCAEEAAVRKKILYINSYGLDNFWARGSLMGALEVLNIRLDDEDLSLDDSHSPVQLRLFNMESKKLSPVLIQKKALEAKGIIDSWKPDLVIAADDNAAKYLVVPYFKNSDIPFVFCGVNWSAAEYGFPTRNVTGMIEVFPVQDALDILRPHLKGERIGFLASDTLSERKNGRYIKDIFNLKVEERYISDFYEFEQAYTELQQTSDLLMFIELTSINNFDEEKFKEISYRDPSIPTVSLANMRMQNFLLICKRVPEEQGEWAARTALKILSGTPPALIPITMNKRAAVRINMELARKLNIKFPMDVIERATFVSEEKEY